MGQCLTFTSAESHILLLLGQTVGGKVKRASIPPPLLRVARRRDGEMSTR